MTTLYQMQTLPDGTITFSPERTSTSVRLDVPWLSQLGGQAAYALGDCGSADVAMLLNFLGHAVTVDEVSAATGKLRGFKLLSWDDLIRAAAHWSVTLTHHLNTSLAHLIADLTANKPVIALVDYKSLPPMNRFDAKYTLGHFLLLVGYDEQSILYHDPYWVDRTGGAFRTLTRAEFERAFSTVASGNTYARQCLRLA